MSAVTTTESAKVTKPSNFSTSPVFAALCSLLSTKYPKISAVVPLIFYAVPFDKKASVGEPNCAKVSTNFPAVIALEPQTELLV